MNPKLKEIKHLYVYRNELFHLQSIYRASNHGIYIRIWKYKCLLHF